MLKLGKREGRADQLGTRRNGAAMKKINNNEETKKPILSGG